jgi:hypothetical protein
VFAAVDCERMRISEPLPTFIGNQYDASGAPLLFGST